MNRALEIRPILPARRQPARGHEPRMNDFALPVRCSRRLPFDFGQCCFRLIVGMQLRADDGEVQQKIEVVGIVQENAFISIAGAMILIVGEQMGGIGQPGFAAPGIRQLIADTTAIPARPTT